MGNSVFIAILPSLICIVAAALMALTGITAWVWGWFLAGGIILLNVEIDWTEKRRKP